MWPLGHAAVAYLGYSASTRTRTGTPPGSLALVALAVGSQLPDLVDKPLSWYLGVLPTGRSLGHSVFFLVPLAAVVYVLARRYSRAEYGLAFGVGLGTHLLADALPLLWGDGDIALMLWPLLSIEGYPDGAPTITGLLLASLDQPYFLSEFVVAGLAAWLWHRDGYPGVGSLRRRLAALTTAGS
ncbi:MAG: metal-dependent hydrolase [Halohasta sp.]